MRIRVKFVLSRSSPIFLKRMSSFAESVVQYISPAPGEFIAYRQTVGKPPGIIFLPGLMSNMEGTKATALERFCREIGQSYVRFDYRGHGMSSGKSEECTIGMRKEDVLTILDNVATGRAKTAPARSNCRIPGPSILHISEAFEERGILQWALLFNDVNEWGKISTQPHTLIIHALLSY